MKAWISKGFVVTVPALLAACGIGPDVSRTVDEPVGKTYAAFRDTFDKLEGESFDGICLDSGCKDPKTGRFTLAEEKDKALDFRMTVEGKDALIIRMTFAAADGNDRATRLTAEVDTGPGFAFRDGGSARFMSEAFRPMIDAMVDSLEAGRPIDGMRSALRDPDAGRSLEEQTRAREHEVRLATEKAAAPTMSTEGAAAAPMVDPDAIARANAGAGMMRDGR